MSATDDEPAPVPAPAPGPSRLDPDLALDRDAPRPPKPRPAGWTLGLPALALLLVLTILRAAPAIETRIRHDVLAAAGEAGTLARSRARIEVDGRDVAIVSDFPLPFELAVGLRERARAVAHVRRVRTEVATAVALDPFRFVAVKGPSGFRLTGGVPSGDVRAAIVDRASRSVPEEAIDDRLRLATGSPDGFADAAAFLIGLLESVETGTASLSGSRLEVSAQAPDRQSYDSLIAAIRRPPAGFEVARVDVVPPLADSYRWSARLDASGLRLDGFVPAETARADLVRSAAARFPGLTVQDTMLTARGLDRRVDFAVASRAALDGLARVRAGTATLEGRTLSFRGETVARTERDALAAAVRASFPPGLAVGTVEIEAVPASPFVFSARRAGGRLEIGGYLPGEPERVLAAGIVARRYPGERLVDRTVLADGAPAGFAQAERLALEALSSFAEGEVAIRDRETRLAGRVLYRQLAERLRGSAAALVPEGWRAEIAVEPPGPDNPLDRFACADLLDEAAQRHPVQFVPGQPALAPNSAPALDFTSDIVRRCGPAPIRVVHVLPTGERPQEARSLAAERAAAIVAALGARAERARLTPEGAVVDGGAERTEFVLGAP